MARRFRPVQPVHDASGTVLAWRTMVQACRSMDGPPPDHTTGRVHRAGPPVHGPSGSSPMPWTAGELSSRPPMS